MVIVRNICAPSSPVGRNIDSECLRIPTILQHLLISWTIFKIYRLGDKGPGLLSAELQLSAGKPHPINYATITL